MLECIKLGCVFFLLKAKICIALVKEPNICCPLGTFNIKMDDTLQ